MEQTELTEALLLEFYAEQRMLKNYIFSIIRDYHATEDLLQEVAVIVVKKAASYDSDKPARPWFIGIARNVTMHWLRSRSRKPAHVSFDLVEECIGDDEIFSAKEILPREQALSVCIQKLPAKQMRVINLRYLDGLRCDRIALRLDKSIQYVYSVLKRTKVSLRKCVEMRISQGTF